MKRTILFLLIIFITFIFAGGLEYPKIKTVKYNIEYRKGITEFVDFSYKVEIEGAYKNYEMLLEVTLYDNEEKEIKTFKELVEIKEFEIQLFAGTKMIPIELVNNIIKVGANLQLLKKKY